METWYESLGEYEKDDLVFLNSECKADPKINSIAEGGMIVGYFVRMYDKLPISSEGGTDDGD